jgi:inhibitor of KinA sporulation pathway (predicted exonuclease)
MIDGRRLEIRPNSIFKSYIRLLPDEKATEHGMDLLTDEVIELTKITREKLDAAPQLSVVWQNFTEYIYKFNSSRSRWNAPVRAGYNNIGFDDVIVDRICLGHYRLIKPYLKSEGIKQHEPYGFGPTDTSNTEQALFHPRDSIDVMKAFVWPWTENNGNIRSISRDSICTWMGVDNTQSHNAVCDVLQTAFMLIKFLRLHRHYSCKVKFEDSFKQENELIKAMLAEHL